MRTVTPILLLALSLGAAEVRAEKWTELGSDEFGFSMLVPAKMKTARKDTGEWGGLFGVLGAVKIYGLARLGAFPNEATMGAFAAGHVAIPFDKWQLINDMRDKRGWTWAKTYRAELAGRVVFSIIGHGPRGAYVIYLATTPASLKQHKLAYLKWYANVKVF
jgi:hypothetical protein